jgi:DNA (cytosine-5)-methyltransferase 1
MSVVDRGFGRRQRRRRSYQAVGLFAGIGGIELGLERAGFESRLLCEIDSAAQRVLHQRFPLVELTSDVRQLATLPAADLVAAGFPCQDLSQAGTTRGIDGARSSLVGQVFRLLENADPRWVLLENVPFMLQLDRGRAMRHLTNELGRLGFRWAYRVVDARAFGLPQRRLRVLLLASRRENPSDVLFADDAGDLGEQPRLPGVACGFYWTEGIRGLGWAVNAVPTLKGGSAIGIPSPPAVWMPDGLIGTPDIHDAERLQGFPAGWTADPDARLGRRVGSRWKMVGNAVCVHVAHWIGQRLLEPGEYRPTDEPTLRPNDPWPKAARGEGLDAVAVRVSTWPACRPNRPLVDFLEHPVLPLSLKAAAGFLGRTERSALRFPDGLLDAVRAHIETMSRRPAA